MSDDTTAAIVEARRQSEICNACRYCEGYCDVFPAMFAKRTFSDGDLVRLANLCHNCRGCYYACQYTEPHAFALNLPAALAEVRAESWERFAWPGGLARLFQRSGTALALALVAGIAALFLAVRTIGGAGDAGFYAYLTHSALVAIFLPAFLIPVLALSVGLRRFWREAGVGALHWRDFLVAGARAADMRNLAGGQGQGCNFEKGDRYSNARRYAHQAVMWGFLLCFGATVAGTVLHYVFSIPAPYGLISLPKLLGLPGGILVALGSLEMVRLKLQSDRALGAARHWMGEMGFLLLLSLTAWSGLILYAAGNTALAGPVLALHLGSVLAFFLLAPYSKMAHAAYRFAALLADAVRTRRAEGKPSKEQLMAIR